MPLNSQKLKQILLATELVPETDLLSAEQEAQENQKTLEEVLIERDLIPDEHLGQLIAETNNWRFVNLRHVTIPPPVLNIIPELMAKKQKAIAFAQDKGIISVAMNDPENLEVIHLLSKKTGDRVEAYYATGRDLRDALARYRKGLKKEFADLIQAEIQKAKGAQTTELPIIKIVDTILQYAYENKASDVHFEPFADAIVIRFRIDGILHDVLKLPKEIIDLVVTRIKVLARLRTDEHRSAQDGKIRLPLEDEELDIRVSIIPITEGEKVVLRLLSARARQFALEDLGLTDNDINRVRKYVKRSTGMILATGPTGSGKTTTLYAILKILNRREVNISTIEDPVEYNIEGVNQIQVNPKTNLTFAQGLRSIVRQDPDIIMVGEIRDEETAAIAINAAMTGHLVLSTLHTNDAATTLPRLLDMKVEPFLVASTVNVVVAQRLVRKICPQCLASKVVTGPELESFKKELQLEKIIGRPVGSELRVYQGMGCPACQQSGYSGRLGIFETLEMTEEIRQLIMQQANSDQIKAKAVSQGMTTMLEDGVRKVLQGQTTFEEILRVIYS